MHEIMSLDEMAGGMVNGVLGNGMGRVGPPVNNTLNNMNTYCPSGVSSGYQLPAQTNPAERLKVAKELFVLLDKEENSAGREGIFKAIRAVIEGA